MSTSILPRPWKEKRDIPNQAGFKLQLLLKNGSIIQDIVCISKEGLHYLNNHQGFKYSQVLGWK